MYYDTTISTSTVHSILEHNVTIYTYLLPKEFSYILACIFLFLHQNLLIAGRSLQQLHEGIPSKESQDLDSVY